MAKVMKKINKKFLRCLDFQKYYIRKIEQSNEMENAWYVHEKIKNLSLKNLLQLAMFY